MAEHTRQRWRDYRTPGGRSPVSEFIDSLPDRDAAAVLAGMAEVRDGGTGAARHLRNGIWELRATGERSSYRVLFSEEGARGRVLLALAAFSKKTQRTPERVMQLAESRRSDWQARGGFNVKTVRPGARGASSTGVGSGLRAASGPRSATRSRGVGGGPSRPARKPGGYRSEERGHER